MILASEHDRLTRRMMDALGAGNAVRAHAAANDAFDAGLGLLELFDQVLAPAMCRIGERWPEGLVRYTQERFASTAADSLLDRLVPIHGGGPGSGWLVAIIAGDEHCVGARMAAATLAASGLRTRRALTLTATELVHAAADADGVCVSCSNPWTAESARAAATAIAASGAPVLLGGEGWGEWNGPPGTRPIGSMAELAAVASQQTALA